MELGIEEQPGEPQAGRRPQRPLPSSPAGSQQLGGAASVSAPRVLHEAVFKCLGFVFTMSVGSETGPG